MPLRRGSFPGEPARTSRARAGLQLLGLLDDRIPTSWYRMTHFDLAQAAMR